MQYAILPVLSLLLVWFLAGAALPFTILAERRRAVTRRRAFYDKSADQIGALFWVTQLLPVLAVAADLLAGGLVARLAVGPWRLVWWTAVGGGFLAALFSLLGRSVRRTGHAGGARFAAWLSGVCAVVAAFCVAVFVWGFLRGAGLDADGGAPAAPMQAFGAVVRAAADAADPGLTVLFGLTCATLAPAAASGLGLIRQALRRGTDDFGRDYYTVTVGARARRASYAGACLLLFSAVLMWLSPTFSPDRLPFLLPGGEDAIRVGVWLFGLGCLGLPVAVLCWYLTARSSVPLRRKALIFMAPAWLWIGVCCLLARLWV